MAGLSATRSRSSWAGTLDNCSHPIVLSMYYRRSYAFPVELSKIVRPKWITHFREFRIQSFISSKSQGQVSGTAM